MELDFTKHKGIVTKRTSTEEYKLYPIKEEDIKPLFNFVSITAITKYNEYQFSTKDIIRIGTVKELNEDEIKDFFSPCLPVTVDGIRFGYRSPIDMFKSISKDLNSEYGVLTKINLKEEK